MSKYETYDSYGYYDDDDFFELFDIPETSGIAQADQCPGGQRYVIRAGDTFYQIAQRFNTTVNALLEANPGVDPRNLRVGMSICIPVPGPTPCPGGTIYTIQAGDTFYLIARRYGISTDALIRANPGVDPNRLMIGQRICIPLTPAPPFSLPCCVALEQTEGTDLPDIAGSAAFIRQVGDIGYIISFTATGLPEPSSYGNFDSYIGTIVMVRDTVPDRATGAQRALPFSAILGLAPIADQPDTWSGSQVIPEAPSPEDIVQLQPYNTQDRTRGSVLFNNTLEGCR